MRTGLWAAVAITIVSTSAPASAQWVQSDWQWKCAGASTVNQHRYWVTQSDRPDSRRVTAKRITVHVNLGGAQRTQVCENADHCDWVMEGPNLGCQKSCSRADVIFADDRVLTTEEQCAR